jgi:acylpyruvate hydrolase
MRFARFMQNGRKGLAADQENGAFNACFAGDLSYPGELDAVIRRGSEALSMAGRDLLSGSTIDLDQVEVLPPLAAPGKIICIGLKYAEHAAESGLELPDYPTVFARFASSLIGHGAPIVRPQISQQLDYEGEVVAIVGRSGRNIPKATALVMSSGIRCSTTFRSATISCGRQSGPSDRKSVV